MPDSPLVCSWFSFPLQERGHFKPYISVLSDTINLVVSYTPLSHIKLSLKKIGDKDRIIVSGKCFFILVSLELKYLSVTFLLGSSVSVSCWGAVEDPWQGRMGLEDAVSGCRAVVRPSECHQPSCRKGTADKWSLK